MTFISAIPKLASMDIQRSIAFFEKLGFTKSTQFPDDNPNYGIVEQDGVQIHFWLSTDPAIPKATGCRINVSGIDELFASYSKLGVIHPNDPLTQKPWGLREFSILDVDGNLVTFAEQMAIVDDSLTAAQVKQIKRHEPQGKQRSVRSSLFELKATQSKR
jgi:hypothetical protein